MTIDECYYLGYIVKAQGLKGTFRVKLDVSDPEEYKELESVFVEIDKLLVPFFFAINYHFTKRPSNYKC